MKPILTAAQMRAAEAEAIRAGTPGIQLMERAAQQIASRAVELAGGSEILFVCGTGNNGGDGLAAARICARRGARVRVALVGDPSRLTEDAAANQRRLAEVAIPVERDFMGLSAGLIVDALFGTGLSRAPEGAHEKAIEWMNAQSAPVLAVDIPSGVFADDGAVPGAAVQADYTVAFHSRNPGHCLYPGRAHCGEVAVCPIGLADGPHIAEHLEPQDVARLLPPRAANTHKGTFGRLLIVAGSLGMAGAASLCARGALHAGAGLTTVATTQEVLPVVQMLAPEAMAALLPQREGAVAAGCARRLGELLRDKDVVAIGPGMTAGEGTREAVRTCLDSGLRCVIDADGLNAIADAPDLLRGAKAPVILTPHPGEMRRLMGRAVGNPLADAREFARDTGAVVLLKGATTAIAAPQGDATLNIAGTPAMARGGSGDVLTGIIAALLAQRMAPYDAARLGAYLHARAGEEAERRHGLAMTPMDMPKYLFQPAE